jgi:hypothetical protein
MTEKIRNPSHVYQLKVDPERIVERDTLQGWILDILVDAGGRMLREDMVKKFTQRLRRKRPDLALRPTSVLSTHQRVLKDQKLISILDERGREIPTRKRVSAVR